jgi:hypothetical protein
MSYNKQAVRKEAGSLKKIFIIRIYSHIKIIFLQIRRFSVSGVVPRQP